MLNKILKDISIGALLKWSGSLLLCIGLWFVLSYIPALNSYIAKPQNVKDALSDNSQVFSIHAFTTLKTTFLGFSLGTFFAVISSFIVLYWKRSESFFLLLSLIIYSIPLIAAAPLAALIFKANNAGIVLGCIGSYLPILLSGVAYSNRTSGNLENVSKGFGANNLTNVRYIKLPLMFRGWIAGAQSGWLWAVLGALLGEFTGSNWGLGTFLTGSLGQGDINKVWAIVILCLSVSLIGVLVLKLINSFFTLGSKYDAIELSASNVLQSLKKGIFVANVINGLIILMVWQILSWVFKMNGGIFAGPTDIFSLCMDIYNNRSDLTFNIIFSALGSTWLLAFFGVLLSLLIAFLLATSQLLIPFVSRPVIIIMLITQVTPIVAFIPFIAYYLGRGDGSVITIVILSTVYPAYLIFKKSFEETSKNAIELAKGFGANPLSIFRKIRLPFAAWMILIALRLAIGRAILGAITAQYLLTGNGLGGLLGRTRHQLDFRIVWLICVLVACATLITVLFTNKLKSVFQSKFSNNLF